MKKLLFSVIALLMVANVAQAQVTIRTNLGSIPFGAFTLGTEFAVASKWTIGIDALYNAFNPYDIYEVKGGMGMVEGRYYLCEAFSGHHFGLYAMGGYYDSITFDNDFLSRVIAGCKHAPHSPDPIEHVWIGFGGLSYGYYFKLGRGWGLDLTIGGGVSMAQYKNPALEDNRTRLSNLHYGVGRLAVDLSYKF